MSDLIYIPDRTQFITRMGDDKGLSDPKIPRIGEADADIKIGGDSNLTKFIPNINISKWDDEYFLKINTIGVQKGDVKSFDGEKIIFERNSVQHCYYLTIEKRPKLEYEIIFASKPSSLEIQFDLLRSDNLRIRRQVNFLPGSVHAPNGPGSYVFYAPKGNNKYRTGKICHFYMPELIDAIGRRTFVEEFWIEGGKIQIVLPGKWLDDAVYPVWLDPLVGTDAIGGSWWKNVDYQILSDDNSATGSATATTAYVYTDVTKGSNGDVKIHLYESSDNNVNLVTGATVEILKAAQATDDWSSAVISWGVSVGNAISMSSGNHGLNYDDIGNLLRWTIVAYADQPEDPFTQHNTTNYLPSVYIDAAAGGNPWWYYQRNKMRRAA